ncbi:MAG: type II toxin-antitoxin system HigB family toxin [Leptonema illini]|uniref:Type II toxin-antitoxin system HigB family toxin n=1 Tax=Leptonema illini TaxID=183 RepID=A0A833LWZ1_9LEPT|nr:MAG: type II toxin-antitoxin system HigB family toxin [Leptonema illini]
MHIISVRRLKAFWEEHNQAKNPLRAWYSEAKIADWGSFADIKARYRSADVVAGDRVIFNIAGNQYRLVVKFDFVKRTGFIKFVGTHAEYDRINVEEVE